MTNNNIGYIRLQIAVVGLGVGMHQARTVYNSSKCDLLWVCDLNQEKLDLAETEFPGVKKTTNFTDIVNDPEVDLVCIASYDAYHSEQVIDSIENYKHVYVEKPLCLTSREALDIRKALNKHPEQKISSNLVLRTCPLFNKVYNAAKMKEIGDIYHMEANYLWGRTNKLLSGWRAEAEYYSIILGAAIHMVDITCWIKGQKPCFVQSLGNNFISAGTDQVYNDFAVILLLFEDFSTAKISAHGGCIHPHFHSLDIFGTKKSFFHNITQTVWVESNDPQVLPKKEYADYPAKEKRDISLISFIDSILLGSNPIINKEDVFTAISVCLAAEKSLSKKEMIKIEYI